MWRILPSSCSSRRAPIESVIGAMELVQGDLLELQPAQAAVAGGAKVLGSTVRGPLVGTRPLEPALGGDHHVVGIRTECLGDERLADLRTV
jgi:hypothetical protein